MGSNTVCCKLSDVATFRNGAGVKQDFFTTSNDGVNLAKVSNFTSDSIDLTDATKVDREHAQKWASHLLKSDDVLIATVGSWPPNWSSVVGKVVRAPKGSEGAIQNQNTCCVIPNEAIDQSYLYYLLKTRQFSEWIVNVAQGSANQARVPVKKIGDFEFELPPIDIQRGVASTLRNLDNKITLNRQINQTLEQMAQTLFKSWFVDFDPVIDNALDAGNVIPDELQARAEQRQALRNAANAANKANAASQPHSTRTNPAAGEALASPYKPLPDDIRQLFPSEFEESELGWVPKGWKCLMLGDFCNELRRGISPKYTEEGGVLVINQKCIRNHEVNYDLARRNDPELRKIDGREILIGDVLINSTGVGTLGRMALVSHIDEKSVVDSHVTIARVDTEKCPIFTFGQLMLSIEGRVERLGEGSTGQTELSRKVLSEQLVVFPPFEISSQIEETFKSIADKKVSNSKQAQILERLRDTLLPKLISGELRLDEVESTIAATTA